MRGSDKHNPIHQLEQVLARHEGESGIVYALSRKRVEEVARKLEKNGHRAAAYHAGLGAQIRRDVHERFVRDEIEVVVASGGVRRHALQIFHPATGRVLSLRPEAGPRGSFQDLGGVCWRGERLYVCEGGAGAVRVFQGGALQPG